MNDTLIIEKLNDILKRLDSLPIRPKWLNLVQAVDYSTLSKETLNRAINRGELKASKVTGKTLIKTDWLDNYLEGR